MDDYRDTWNDATKPLGSIAAGGSKGGTLESDGDDDVFAITLVAGRTYTFVVRGAQDGGGTLTDPYVELRGADGGYLGAGYDYADTDGARLVYTATASGTYYLTAAATYIGATGSYTLSASAGYNDDYRDTFNNTIEPLGTVAPGGSATGVIEIVGDQDVMAVTLVAGRTYTFDLKGVDGGGGTLNDPHLELRGTDGSYLAAGFDFNGTKDARIVHTATESGTYYLTAAGTYGGTTGSYTLSASAGFVDDYRDTFNSTIETLGTVATGGSKTGSIEIGGDKDVFAVTLVAGRTYTIDMKGAPGGGGTLADAYLELRDAGGSYLTAGFDFNDSKDARIVHTAAESGTYYLTAAATLGDATGTYTVSVSSGFNDDYRDTVTDTSETLGTVAAGGSSTGMIETNGDKDIFAVTLVAGRTYTIDLKGVPGGGGTLADAYLELHDSGGSYLTAGFDFNGTKDSRLVYTADANATYYIVAAGQTTAITGTYTVSVSSGFVDDYRDTFNDTAEPLGTVTRGGSKTGVIESDGDKDVFAVTLTAGYTYTFGAKGTPSGGTLADPRLELRDTKGAYVANGLDGLGTKDAGFSYTAATTGTHYLTVDSQPGTGTGSYTVTASTGVLIDDYRDAITDTTAPLGTLAIGGSRTGRIETNGDRDIFAVTLQAGKTYTFDMAGSTAIGAALADGELRLLDSAGKSLRFNEDFNGAAPRIVYTATKDGTYYLDAGGDGATDKGSYVLTAKVDHDDYRDTIGDTTAPFGPLTVGSYTRGTVETTGDHDLFAVTLVAGRSYTFDLLGSSAAGASLANPELRLLDGTGKLLRLNDDFNAAGSRIVYTATASGTYYLDASSHTASGTGTYALRATANFDDYRDTIADTTAPLGALTVGGSRLGTVETTGDRDLFAVTLVAGRSYTFDLAGSTAAGHAVADVDLRLLDSAGALLRYNDDFNGASARIVYTATANGTYYLDAGSHVLSGTGTYSLGATLGFDDYRDTMIDTTAPFGVVKPGSSWLGTIETVGDHDLLAVKLVAGSTYTFDLAGSTAGGMALSNGVLQLLSSGGKLLRVNDDFNSFDSHIVYSVTKSGTYYLDIGGNTGIGTYSVKVTAGFDDYRDAIADTTAPFGAVTVGTPRLGTIETVGDHDLLAVTLVAGKSYTFDLAGSATAGAALANSALRLLAGNGTVLRSNDDFNGAASRIVYTATTSGTYYLDASSQTASGTGTYAVTATLGFDDYRDSLTDTTAPFGALAVNGTRLGTIEIGKDRDLFSISLVAGKTYTFDLAGSLVGDDTLANGVLRLLDGSGAVLRLNDDFNSVDSRIVYTATASGTYYLDVRALTSTDVGTYSLSARLGFDDYRDTLTDNTAPFGTLAVGTATLATLETAGDKDVFAVTLLAGKTYTFDLAGSSLAGAALPNGELRLLDSAGSVLRFNDDFNGAASRIVFTATTGGTYYLEARGHTATDTGTYSLSARLGFDDYRDGTGDATAALGKVAIGGTQFGNIETAGDPDLFAVTLVAGKTYAFDLAGADVAGRALANGDLSLLAKDGSLIDYSDDVNGMPDARIVYTAAVSGTHYLNVRGVGINTGTYELSAMEQPAPMVGVFQAGDHFF